MAVEDILSGYKGYDVDKAIHAIEMRIFELDMKDRKDSLDKSEMNSLSEAADRLYSMKASGQLKV